MSAPRMNPPSGHIFGGTDMRFPTPLDNIKSEMELLIITDGYSVQSAIGGPAGTSWTYTVGLSKSFGLPELVITNLDPDDAFMLVSWVIEQLRAGGDIADFDAAQFRPVPVHKTHLDGELMKLWREYYDEDPSTVDVVQLQLGPELACPCCIDTQVDLTNPKASILPSRRLNRAQRRARKKMR